MNQETPTPAELPPRTIVGYSSATSVRAGDTLEFMVSSLEGADYEADLVRVINGDGLSRYRDRFEVQEIEAAFTGSYSGAKQDLNLGSYVHVKNCGDLDSVASFTVGAWINPSFDPSSYEPPDPDNIDHFTPPTLCIAEQIGDQVIVSRYDKTSKAGWCLYLDKSFHLTFLVSNEQGQCQSARVDQPMRAWDWAYVMVAVDAAAGTLSLYVRDMPLAPGDQYLARTLTATSKISGQPQQHGPLRIGAARGGPGAAKAHYEKPVDGFNGRIQDVRIVGSALGLSDIEDLSQEEIPIAMKDQLLANWDFGRGIDTLDVEDVSGRQLHGELVNLAERAVRGRFWDGSTTRWTDDPNQYDAIKFHADDLYDAQWAPAFNYTVPDDLPGGIYAARLKQKKFVEYITFFVAAPKGKPAAKLALWLADNDYLAYANITLVVTAADNYPGHNFNASDADFYRDNLEYGTGGVYNMHVDGQYFAYGSRLRPDLHMKPNGLLTYNFVQDTHITAFLEHEGIDYDIITDELVDAEGLALLKQYAVVISSTHPEYPGVQMVDDVRDYTAQGGRFFYGGGNGWFWATDRHPAASGVLESRNFHEIGERYLTSGRRGGQLMETGRHTGPIFGNEMSGMVFNGSSPYRKLAGSADIRAAWIFEGTSEGEVFGDYGVDRVCGGAAGFEIDKYNPGNGVPRHALHLATSEPLKPLVESVQLGTGPYGLTYHPAAEEVHAAADMVFFESANGGAMFSTGSITWFSSTLENDFQNDVATISRNVIQRFLDPAPFTKSAELSIHSDSRAGEPPRFDR